MDEVFEELGEVGVAKLIAEDKYNSAVLPLAKVWLAGKDREMSLKTAALAAEANSIARTASLAATAAAAAASEANTVARKSLCISYTNIAITAIIAIAAIIFSK